MDNEVPRFRFVEKDETAIMTIGGKEYEYGLDEVIEIIRRSFAMQGRFYRIIGDRRRDSLADYIRRNPGQKPSEIVEANKGLSPGGWSRLYWDISRLSDEGRIRFAETVLEDGSKERRVYPADPPIQGETEQ